MANKAKSVVTAAFKLLSPAPVAHKTPVKGKSLGLTKSSMIHKPAITKGHTHSGKAAAPIWISTFKGEGGKIEEQIGKSLAADAGGVFQLLGGTVNYSTYALTQKEAFAIAAYIDKLNEGCDHLDIKTNAWWKSMYQLADRPNAFMATNGTIPSKSIPTMPCHNCGIILPVDCIQVDHYMPQADGEPLYTLKTLRALGLTLGVATGQKGANYTTLSALVLAPKGRERGDYEHLALSTPHNKWTTNEKGTAFLSLCAHAGGLTDIYKMCKNSILNLVPLCGACNRMKSDWVRPIK